MKIPPRTVLQDKEEKYGDTDNGSKSGRKAKQKRKGKEENGDTEFDSKSDGIVQTTQHASKGVRGNAKGDDHSTE